MCISMCEYVCMCASVVAGTEKSNGRKTCGAKQFWNSSQGNAKPLKGFKRRKEWKSEARTLL